MPRYELGEVGTVATKSERLAELRAELAKIKAAQNDASEGMSSFNMQGLSGNFTSLQDLQRRRTEIEKSIQRLKRGGRGIVVDMSYAGGVA